MTPGELGALALLGGLVGLDVVSFPQAMISRPIVAGTLGGVLAGEPLMGLLAGAALELLALETLPVGASWYPEWGSAAVVGGALFASSAAGGVGALALALLAAVVTAWIGGWSMQTLRRINGILARRNLQSIDAGDANTVLRLQLGGLAADFIRGALLTCVAFILLKPAVALLLARWGVSLAVTSAVVVGIAAAVAGSAAWKRSSATPAARWYLAGGLAVGLLVLALQ